MHTQTQRRSYDRHGCGRLCVSLDPQHYNDKTHTIEGAVCALERLNAEKVFDLAQVLFFLPATVAAEPIAHMCLCFGDRMHRGSLSLSFLCVCVACISMYALRWCALVFLLRVPIANIVLYARDTLIFLPFRIHFCVAFFSSIRSLVAAQRQSNVLAAPKRVRLFSDGGTAIRPEVREQTANRSYGPLQLQSQPNIPKRTISTPMDERRPRMNFFPILLYSSVERTNKFCTAENLFGFDEHFHALYFDTTQPCKYFLCVSICLCLFASLSRVIFIFSLPWCRWFWLCCARALVRNAKILRFFFFSRVWLNAGEFTCWWPAGSFFGATDAMTRQRHQPNQTTTATLELLRLLCWIKNANRRRFTMNLDTKTATAWEYKKKWCSEPEETCAMASPADDMPSKTMRKK